MHPELFPCASDRQNFIRVMVCAPGIAGIAAKCAISAIVAAEIGQGNENLAGIGDDAGLESLFCGARRSEKLGQVGIGAAQSVASAAAAKSARRAERRRAADSAAESVCTA